MPDPTATVTVTAPAKLTLSLRITGVRDDGYHLIDAVMVALDLADELAIGAGDGLEVVGATGLAVPADDDNLVRRALRLVGRTAHVELTKRIPSGAGLGGGSADAGAILRWAGVDDPAVAVALGADVPFCVRGGRARVRGVGEEVEPLAFEGEALGAVVAAADFDDIAAGIAEPVPTFLAGGLGEFAGGEDVARGEPVGEAVSERRTFLVGPGGGVFAEAGGDLVGLLPDLPVAVTALAPFGEILLAEGFAAVRFVGLGDDLGKSVEPGHE